MQGKKTSCEAEQHKAPITSQNLVCRTQNTTRVMTLMLTPRDDPLSFLALQLFSAQDQVCVHYTTPAHIFPLHDPWIPLKNTPHPTAQTLGLFQCSNLFSCCILQTKKLVCLLLVHNVQIKTSSQLWLSLLRSEEHLLCITKASHTTGSLSLFGNGSLHKKTPWSQFHTARKHGFFFSPKHNICPVFH